MSNATPIRQKTGSPRKRGPFKAKPAYKTGATSGHIALRGSWWYSEQGAGPLVVVEVGALDGRYLGTIQVRLTNEKEKP